MAFEPDHELHKRRLGRNLGIGLSLLAFVVIVFGMTIVKVAEQPQPHLAAKVAVGTKP